MRRKIFTAEGHYHYVTFSCYGRRKLLKDAAAKNIVIHVLSKITHEMKVLLIGFVVMPDHVHAILGYNDDSKHSITIQEIKRRSSRLLKKYLIETNYPFIEKLKIERAGTEVARIWQPRFYDFNLFTEPKLLEKLNYMHANPVRARLVQNAADYRWSSCRFYEAGKSVGAKITPVF